ncbi:roadblock/LC7 domain-containing protein [Nocardiopsis ganjiahuensis]|uniref:roadblock/LC7 domain-containing protein n=1 Tax=Nocardiopsis ganjiahuensis TaxID=239984 RepID=UPI001360B0ED|nr:roadblock/LC7 domain-containing protein [Nocardiopsis ganjiahuensis]
MNQLVQETGTSYGVVFGTHGLHLLRAGDLDQVGAESVTAILTNVLLLSLGAGKLTARGEAETIVIRYESGALVLAPLGSAFGLGLFVGGSDNELKQVAYALARFAIQAEPLLPQEDLASRAEGLRERRVPR